MAYGKRKSTTRMAMEEVLSVSPLPYPVLLILGVALVFLGSSWFLSYDSAVEDAQDQINWLLFLLPISLLFAAIWLSSLQDPTSLFFSSSPWDRRRRTHHIPSEGSSPWAVAALIVFLLVLAQYHSIFRDSWLI